MWSAELLHLLADCGRVQEEGDVLHRLSVTADFPGDVVSCDHQMFSSRSVDGGDVHGGGSLRGDGRGGWGGQLQSREGFPREPR